MGGEGQRNPYCVAVIPPKLQKLRKSFQARAKSAIGDRLSGGAAQAIVDRRAEAGVGYRRDGDPQLAGRVGLVKQVEQPCCGFDKVTERTEADVARHIAEPDQNSSAAADDALSRSGFDGA